MAGKLEFRIMKLKQAVKILVIASVVLFSANIALAGFGISPPYVWNDRLIQDSHYEQKIILVRDDPTEDLKIEITYNVPWANDWISIDKGLEFILPKGEKQMPIIVSVDVPEDAELGSYKGAIRIRTSSLKPPEGGIVTLALGGQIDVKLTVVGEEIFDFRVRSIKTSDLEEGWTIKFLMEIENTGNIESAPTKVHFDIYDSKREELLESVDNVNQLETIKPFETKKIIAELPTQLGPGSYWAQFKIFRNEEVVREGEVPLSILSEGAIQVIQVEEPAEESSSWFQNLLSKFSLLYFYIGAGVILLVLVGLLIWLERKRRRMTPRKKKTIKRKKIIKIMDIKKKEE